MEPLRIYSKTAQGAAALNAARGAVSSSARQLLILIDGRRDVGELRGIFGEETVSRLLPQLEAQGYVKRVRDSTRTPPPTISPVQHAPVPPRNGIAVSGPSAGPPGNFLAKAALASGVILVSGTIWWFLGGSGVPGIAPAPDASNAPPNAATTPDTIAAVSAAPVLVAPISQPPNGQEPIAQVPINRAPLTPAPPRAAPALQASSAVAERNRSRGRDGNRPDASSNTSVATAPADKEPANQEASAPARSAAVRVSSTTAAKQPPETTPAPPAPAVVASLAAGIPVPSSPAAPLPPPALTSASAAGSAAVASRPAPPADPAIPVLHARERPVPALSRTAQRAGIDSGELVVRLHVSSRGTVDAVDVVKASPRQLYDAAVEKTLKSWTFDPPGIPVLSTVRFDFKP